VIKASDTSLLDERGIIALYTYDDVVYLDMHSIHLTLQWQWISGDDDPLWASVQAGNN
jgi:hypothetical protein